MGGVGKKPSAGPSGVKDWISTACRFAMDRNDFRRVRTLRIKGDLYQNESPLNFLTVSGKSQRNLLVNLGLFAAGVWVARNLSDFDLMSPQPVT